MATVTEIAPDVYRISTYESQFKLQFNQFLVKDKEPLLFHTGMKGMFPVVREAVARILDPATIRWIGFSHFESDECGSLNEWLQAAPLAQPLCTVVAAREVSVPPLYHPSPAALLGCGDALRGDEPNVILFGPVPPGRRCGTSCRHRCGGAGPKGDDRLSIYSIAERHPLQFRHGAPDGEAGRAPAEDPGSHAWVLVCG